MRLEPVAVAMDGTEVVAACWPAGRCPVLDHLAELERSHPRVWREAIMFLDDHLPNAGLPPVVGHDTSRAKAVSPSRKQLRGSLWEVRLSERPAVDPLDTAEWIRAAYYRAHRRVGRRGGAR